MAKLRFPLLAVLVGLLLSAIGGSGQPAITDTERIVGQPWSGERGVERSTADIMADPAARMPRKNTYLKREREIPGRENRPQHPNARFEPQMPPGPARTVSTTTISSTNISSGQQTAQTVGTTFLAALGPADTGAFPPDSMGAVGPSQFVVFLNGFLRTFSKTTGAPDNVLHANPDTFFSSVMTPGYSTNFTSDPQIRYDRLSGRWILSIIDVPSTSPAHTGNVPNRVLIAVSDAASAGVITSNTVWTFYYVQQNTVGGANTSEFLDYDSL